MTVNVEILLTLSLSYSLRNLSVQIFDQHVLLDNDVGVGMRRMMFSCLDDCSEL